MVYSCGFAVGFTGLWIMGSWAGYGVGFKPSLRSSPMTPPRFRSLGQPDTRFADEKVVTQ